MCCNGKDFSPNTATKCSWIGQESLIAKNGVLQKERRIKKVLEETYSGTGGEYADIKKTQVKLEIVLI